MELDINKELLRGTEWLEDFEGFRSTPYLDSEGIETIGIGRNLEIFPLDLSEVKDIEDNNGEWAHVCAVQWAYDQLKDCRKSLIVGAPWVVRQPSDVRLILTDMVYNLGLTGLWNFKKMLKALKTKDYSLAAEELKDSRYYGQTGRRAEHHYGILKEL